MLGLRFFVRAFSSCGESGPLFIAVRGPLTIAASLVAEQRLQTLRLSSCGSWAQLLRGMWDPPRPGPEPVSPALAGRFSTTAPPGKPYLQIFWWQPSWLVCVALLCISLISNVEDLFMCLLAIRTTSLENVYSGLLSIFWLGCLSLLSCMSCLYILDINPLLVASFANIFSHSIGCLFLLLIVSFAVQKLLSLIRPHLFIFAFISFALEADLRKYCYDLW